MKKYSGFLLITVSLAVGMALSQLGCPGDISNGGTEDGGLNKPLDGLLSLAITPTSATLGVDNNGAQKTQAYTVLGRFGNGEPERDVTNQVNWKIDNPAIGSVASNGVFTTSNMAGGQGIITAYSGTVSATAQITVNFTPVISDSSAPGNANMVLPPTATGTVVAGNSPTVLYPSSKTMFPRNIYKILFTFNGGTGNDLYRLEFKSPVLTLSVYTTSTSWTPTQQQWGYMANSNAGGKVTWTIYATKQSSPGTVYQSTPVELYFSKNTVEGAIYYWSTTVAGVRRATVSDAAPTDFLTPAQTGKCVACHTVSRNGARIAVDIGGSALGVYEVKDRTPVVNPATNIQTAWTTFNPDNSRIVTASKGVLTLRDGNTGTPISVGGNSGVIPLSPKYGTMPDWSPDGKLLTFAYSSVSKDRGISGSSIATMQYANGTFTNLKVIVQSAGNSDSKFYPAFSPDSKWIAFVSTSNNGSDNNPLARLMIVAADGSSPPIDLGQANTVVNNQTLTGNAAQLADTFPTWAPTMPGDTMFLAFSSSRAYANVYAATKYKQLWVTGIDPTKLPGQDPSFPAFRLPFQGDTENTHRPYWVEDVLNPPPTGGGGVNCLSTFGADCSSAPCCEPYYCSSTSGGPPYYCQTTIG